MKRILIIDDEQRIGQSYSMLLSEEGYEVRYASGAEEATENMIRERFDLVLLDINMPEVDGKVMYEVVREYDQHMKVIVSSVHTVEDQIQSILGACAYHNKAEGIDILLEKIREVLDGNDTQKDSRGGRRAKAADIAEEINGGERISRSRSGKRRGSIGGAE